jgi:hypothetical protein
LGGKQKYTIPKKGQSLSPTFYHFVDKSWLSTPLIHFIHISIGGDFVPNLPNTATFLNKKHSVHFQTPENKQFTQLKATLK